MNPSSGKDSLTVPKRSLESEMTSLFQQKQQEAVRLMHLNESMKGFFNNPFS